MVPVFDACAARVLSKAQKMAQHQLGKGGLERGYCAAVTRDIYETFRPAWDALSRSLDKPVTMMFEHEAATRFADRLTEKLETDGENFAPEIRARLTGVLTHLAIGVYHDLE